MCALRNTEAENIFRFVRFESVTGLHILSNVFVRVENSRFTKNYKPLYVQDNNSSVIFKHNIISNSYDGFGMALTGANVGGIDTLDFRDNLITCNNVCLEVAGQYFINRLYIRRNTIIGKSLIWGHSMTGQDSIISNIFTNLEFFNSENRAFFFAYNNIEIGDFTKYPLGTGSKNIQNINGDSADLFYNIFENSLIYNPLNGVLENNSPCISAGLENENMGYYQGSGIVAVNKNRSFKGVLTQNINAYPNPFNPSTIISFPNPEENVELFIYDISGREIKRYSNIKTNKIVWNAGRMANGLYVIKAETGNNVYTKIITLLK